MHVASSLIVVLSTFFSTALGQPDPTGPHAIHAPRSIDQPDVSPAVASALRKRDAWADAYVRWELTRAQAADLRRRDAAPAPQLQLLGGAIRGLGKGASKAPEKAGGKAAKEQGKNAGKDGENPDDKKTGEMMAKNLKAKGYKDADAGCLARLVSTLKRTGSNNGDYSSCWKKPDKNSIGSRASSARKAAFDAAKKKGLM